MTDILERYAVPTGPASLRFDRLLPGPIERVWSYLTDSDLRSRWLAEGEMELREGSTFELVWRHDRMVGSPGRRPEDEKDHRADFRMLRVDPPHTLSFEWIGSGIVTFTLAEEDGQVRLTLRHEKVPTPGIVLGVSAGWHAHLDVLVADLTGGKAAPFWDRLATLRDDYRARLAA
jgi:uncharacterized protein YndB with AHSA1/START domain